MDNQIIFGVTDEQSGYKDEILLTNMSNRHGCITGATGTGKTVSLQKHRQYYRKNLTFLHSFYLLFDFDSFLCLSESILSDFSVNFHRFLLDLVEIFLDFF